MSSDATAVVNQKQLAGKSRGWSKQAIIWTCIACFFSLIVAVFVVWIAGLTHGREFDAGNWAFRRFTFIRNPITGNQLTGLQRSSDFAIPGSITVHTKGGPLEPSTRWDLVEMNKGTSYCTGPAQVLLDYLSAMDQKNNYYWEQWTSSHPNAAPVLWTAVRDCVHLSRYDRLPELFETARVNTEPEKLKPLLQTLMLDIAQDEAKLQAALGNDEAKKRAEKLADAYR